MTFSVIIYNFALIHILILFLKAVEREFGTPSLFNYFYDMKTKTYIIQRTISQSPDGLTITLSLYRRVLEDGTDLHWNYSVGREPLLVESGLHNDREDVRVRLVRRAIELGIVESDIDYCY